MASSFTLPPKIHAGGVRLNRVVGVALLVLGSWSARGQESIRPSNTGALAAEARHNVPETRAYNLKFGQVTMDASAAIDVEFTDNVGLSENNRESDVIFRPRLNLDTAWQVTNLNTLRLNLGVGYELYTQSSHADTRSLLIDPGSAISFDVYVGGNMRLNFHDRLSIVQNPLDDPNLSNVVRFDRLQNSAGVTAIWDLNDVAVVLGYDHFDYRSLGDDFNFLDRREEQIFASATARLNDALTVGLESSVAFVDYLENFNNDGTVYSVGPLVEAQVSAYTKVRAAGGYQGMTFDDGGESGDTDDFNGWYFNFSIAQRLNQYWSHTVSVGHEARLGLEVNFAEYTFARYVADWRVNARTNVNFEGFVEDANESGTSDQDSEHAFRWGLGAGASWRLGSRTTLGLRYRYTNKDSDLALRSYYQSVATLSVGYDF